MPASAKAVGPATRKARAEVKSSIWLTIGARPREDQALMLDGETEEGETEERARVHKNLALAELIVSRTII